MRKVSSRYTWTLGIVIWLALIAAGYICLLRYNLSAGKATAAPRDIPAWLAAGSAVERPQLVIALHPHCSCSRATLNELAKILSRAPNTCDVIALTYVPENALGHWLETELVDKCRRLNGRIHPDPEGKLAVSLGSLTSGGVLLYDAEGSLCYQGGLTAARGHEGDNLGARTVLNILRGGRQDPMSLPVFGCPLQSETEETAL